MKRMWKQILTVAVIAMVLCGAMAAVMSMTVFAAEKDSDRLSLEGLNVLCLGDSITAGQGLTTATRWTNVLASKYGWNLTNKSQGGISLSSYYYTTNDQTDVSIAKKAEVLKTMTTTPDVIIVWGGHNDTGYRYSPLGTWDDETTDSFKGALRYIAELVEEYAPDAALFVLTPLGVNENPSTLKVPANTADNNWMFVDAIYEGADIYGWIPINMDLCGITPFTKSSLLLDNIHPNEAGTEKIVEYLSAELASYGETSKKDTILFNKSDISMKTGESITLKAVQTPRSGNSTPAFTWSSSSTSVATVDASGKIAAVAHGNATITATTSDGTSASVSVTVDKDAHTYQNGLCTGCGAEEPIPGVNSLEELTLALRREMVERNPSIQLRVNGMTVTNAELSSVIGDAMAHTGVGKEGDYIRAHIIGGYTYSSEVVSDPESGDTYSVVTVNCSFISTAEMEAEMDAAVEALLNELDLWNATDYRKIKGVYDWITEHIDYDYEWDDEAIDEKHYRHTAHAALVDRKVVCQGYASLFYRLMLELDVDCRYITGMSNGPSGSEHHAWNIVRLENVYYNMDPTWDRDLTGYYRFFLCTETNFAWHDRDSQFNSAAFHAAYPMATLPFVENVTASGTVNSKIKWVLDGDTGTLTVAGSGAIPSYRYSHAPWYDYRESIRKIVVEEGITEVGERAFYWSINCTEVVLPDSLIAVREYGFNNLRNLKSITLPQNLKIIEFCGFSECVALESIVLPDSVTTVGSSAFSNCYALKSAVLSAGMKTVPNSMFFGDYRLTSVTLPDGITKIGDTAFADCGLRSFTIPSTLTSLGTSALSGCKYLTAYTVEAGNTAYKSVNGVLFSADGTHLVAYPAAKTGNYTIPEGTKYIDYGAFSNQKYMNKVYFPSSLISIGGYAFSDCLFLGSVTFPSTLPSIGNDAFRGCTYLTSVTFENPTVTLGDYLFSGCTSLKQVTLPSRLSKIPNGLFDDCTSLRSISIPTTVTSIGSTAFCNCDALTEITIPGNVKSIGQQAFDFCQNLTTITLEEGVTKLGFIAIRNAPRLRKVVIPKSLTGIEQPYNTSSYMFDGCPNMVLYVVCGSYGYSYAQSRGLSYNASHEQTVTVVPATCTRQGYTHYRCSCGYDDYNTNYTPALGHAFDAWEIVTAPTCTEAGTQYRACFRCGLGETEAVATLGHSFGDWYETKAPTESAQGEKRRDCDRCDHFETTPIAPLTHDHSRWDAIVLPAVAPTCTENGLTEGKKCSGCGEILVNQESVPALGHSFGDWYETKAPTESAQGEKRRDCDRCDHFETTPIASLTHDHSRWDTIVLPAVTPTCTENGLTEGKKCSGCGEILVNQESVPALGHSFGDWYETKAPTESAQGEKRRDCDRCDHFETTPIASLTHDHSRWDTIVLPAVAPTCTENGLTEGKKCSGCGEILITQESVPALGHSFGDWYETKAPTESAQGEKRRDCDRCDHFETTPIAPLAHDHSRWDAIVLPVVAPTCTESGLTEGKKCSGCGEILVAQETIPALGHSFGDWYETKAPTESAQGEKRRDCTRCDHFETTPIAPLAHDHSRWDAIVLPAVAPTCTESGLTEGKKCSGCGEILVTQEIIPALGHSFGDWYETKAPTESAQGEKRRDCDRCDEYETTPIAPLTHDHSRWDAIVLPAVAPTCTATGLTEGKKCSGCGEILVAQEIIPALGHRFGDWYETKAPTESAQGEKRRDCVRCDYFETTPIAPLTHDHSRWDAIVLPAVAPTCTATGLTEGKKCSGCGEILVAQEIIPALGHRFGDWYETKAPTESAQGEKRRDCDRCDHFETTPIAPLTHDHSRWDAIVLPAVAPTCTENGLTEGKKCSGCGEILVNQESVPALGHSFGDWYETKAPTESAQGEKRRDCDRCDHFETTPIASLTHDHSRWDTIVLPAVAPTCTENGLTEGKKCSGCGEILITQESVPALGHSFGDWYETKAPTCTEKGREQRDCSNCDHFETREIKALGHKHESIVTPSTCTEQGYTTHICHCGDTYTDNYVNALGHAWNDGVIVTQPTTDTPGEKRFTCTVCGREKSEEIPVIAYEIGNVDGNSGVNSSDAIYLLMHTFFPEEYPINQDGDYDRSGAVDSNDAVYLLMHTFFPKEYPLAMPTNVVTEVPTRRKEDEE